MYAKVFRQMYDGTLATNGPWEALVTFQQLLVLANDNGEVDMTASAIARTTTIPLNIIERGLGALCAPDPESRTPDEEGRRIVLLSEHRAWGWRIVNYLKYRAIQKEAERREYHRRYYHEVRKKAVELNTSQQASTASTVSTDTEAEEEAEAEEEKAPAVLVAKGDAYSVPPCPFQDLLASYHENCPSLPRVRILTNMRQKHARARWIEVCTAEKWGAPDGLAWFDWYFKTAESSPFLSGRRGGKDRVWRADFEWLMSPGNLAKVVEGRYKETA